jgi:hypothetical protein
MMTTKTDLVAKAFLQTLISPNERDRGRDLLGRERCGPR